MSIVILGITLLVLVLAISRLHVHPFLALLCSGLLLGLAIGMPLDKTLNSLLDGFAGTLKWIGIVMVLGAVIGEILTETGGSFRIAESTLRLVGEKRVPFAMGLTGYVIAIPVFVDVAYIMLRTAMEDPERKARFAAVYGIVAFVTVPLSWFAIRWWRTIHPDVLTAGEGMAMTSRMVRTVLAGGGRRHAVFVVMPLTRWPFGFSGVQMPVERMLSTRPWVRTWRVTTTRRTPSACPTASPATIMHSAAAASTFVAVFISLPPREPHANAIARCWSIPHESGPATQDLHSPPSRKRHSDH